MSSNYYTYMSILCDSEQKIPCADITRIWLSSDFFHRSSVTRDIDMSFPSGRLSYTNVSKRLCIIVCYGSRTVLQNSESNTLN